MNYIKKSKTGRPLVLTAEQCHLVCDGSDGVTPSLNTWCM